jgi:hypothetical protein
MTMAFVSVVFFFLSFFFAVSQKRAFGEVGEGLRSTAILDVAHSLHVGPGREDKKE